MRTFSASEISIVVPLLSVAVMLSTVPPCVYTVIGVPGAALLTSVHACPVPVLSIVIGEGGSGGALALAAGDQVWMMENSIYSILSPEGFASILWKDSTRAKEAAEVMKLTATDLKNLGIIEQVIPENQPLTRENMADTMEELKNRIEEFLEIYQMLEPEKLLNKRYTRFRNL